MKLEKIIRLYYSEKIRSVHPVPFPEMDALNYTARVKTIVNFNNPVFNLLSNIVIAMIAIFMIYNYNADSALAERLTERADEIRLNVLIKTKIDQLDSTIKDFKNHNQ